MQVQSDYETDLILAVFSTLEGAERAVQNLVQQHIHGDRARHRVLPPGRYDLADVTLGEEMSGVVRGAEFGVPVGAVIGLGAAASLLGGAAPEVWAGMAAGGAFVGGILGALEGAVLRAHFDDNVAAVHEVRDGFPEVLLILQAESADDSATRARRLLTAAGAMAFLDSSAFQLS